MSKNVVATIREDAPFVPAGRYYLFSEPAGVDADADRRGQRAAAAHAGQGRVHAYRGRGTDRAGRNAGSCSRVYKVRPIALTLTDVQRHNQAALSVSYRAENLAVLQELGTGLPQCRRAEGPACGKSFHG